MHCIYLPVGPTKAPENIRVDSAAENELILFWDPIPCSDQNGNILYYVVRYTPIYHQQVFPVTVREQDSRTIPETVREQDSRTMEDTLTIILRNLHSNTEYNITVAGVNSAGIGTFSSPIMAITFGGKQYMNLVVNCSHGMIPCSFISIN